MNNNFDQENRRQERQPEKEEGQHEVANEAGVARHAGEVVSAMEAQAAAVVAEGDQTLAHASEDLDATPDDKKSIAARIAEAREELASILEKSKGKVIADGEGEDLVRFYSRESVVQLLTTLGQEDSVAKLPEGRFIDMKTLGDVLEIEDANAVHALWHETVNKSQTDQVKARRDELLAIYESPEKRITMSRADAMAYLQKDPHMAAELPHMIARGMFPEGNKLTTLDIAKALNQRFGIGRYTEQNIIDGVNKWQTGK